MAVRLRRRRGACSQKTPRPANTHALLGLDVRDGATLIDGFFRQAKGGPLSSLPWGTSWVRRAVAVLRRVQRRYPFTFR
ncbi:hypothetical protein [Mycolicibacterium sp.]|uniref:hypothetical protein n=1 Tax=Mycolicibacterium sp. TaxID=2320850 RepID=UPI001A317246|nr:hypothetical protein [Mycolicibacterium sp.]MBJ7400567.1 hypothetical protein [Mycolicibacterium sp.]